jgi:transposase
MELEKSTYGQKIVLTKKQEGELVALQRSSDVDAKAARRARILELLGRGKRQCEVAEQTGAGIATVGRARRRFLEESLEAAVFGYVSPGAPRILDESDEAKIVSLACTDPPAGRARWTTELLAVEAVKRGFVPRVGRETVRLVLKHHGLKPWREKNVPPASLREDKGCSAMVRADSE